MASTFRVLLVWLYGTERYRDLDIDEELTPAQLTAFAMAAGRRPYGFGLVVRRSWRDEYQLRGIKLPYELRYLEKLPNGAAVDHLLGYQDGKRWRPGIAGLEPTESRAVRYRCLEFRPTEDACGWLDVKPNAYYKFVSEGLRKLRLYFGIDEGKIGAPGPAIVQKPSGPEYQPASRAS